MTSSLVRLYEFIKRNLHLLPIENKRKFVGGTKRMAQSACVLYNQEVKRNFHFFTTTIWTGMKAVMYVTFIYDCCQLAYYFIRLLV